MAQVTARISGALVARLDRAAKTLGLTRADVIRRAIEDYLENREDLRLAIEALRDPADGSLDWEEIRDDLMAKTVASV